MNETMKKLKNRMAIVMALLMGVTPVAAGVVGCAVAETEEANSGGLHASIQQSSIRRSGS